MSEQKGFFENLSPKSSLLAGVITGVLVICTLGFFIMIGVYLGGDEAKSKADDDTIGAEVDNRGQVEPVAQAPKSDKPVVELFVMSYCPYGLQMEKAFLPAWSLLKGKADISIKFVNYAMHGLTEIEEQTRQACIANQEEDVYIEYLKCFTLAGDSEQCIEEVGVNTTQLSSCVDELDSQYGIMDYYNDQSSWLSGVYPIYPLHDSLNKQYGVEGSPTLVINGKQISVSRTPENVKKVICAAFNEVPEECNTQLSTAGVSASFGAGTAGDEAAYASCGA